MPDQVVNQYTEPVDPAEARANYEEKIAQMVRDDFAAAKTWCDEYHEWCVEMDGLYHNARNYDGLKRKNRFPDTSIQEDIDHFVADARFKLFNGARPCAIVGREETDKKDAEAKQEFQDYQDAEDQIFKKVGRALHDAGLSRMAINQVDYKEESRREWVAKDIPEVYKDAFGDPILNETGEPIPLLDEDGNEVPSGKKEWELVDVPIYRGATVKRIDPIHFYWTKDKHDMGDEWPVMIWSRRTRRFFSSKPYFINQNLLEGRETGNVTDDRGDQKSVHAGFAGGGSDSKKGFAYVEWQGRLDKRELYTYIGKPEEELRAIKPGETVSGIVGLVDDKVVVQLREEPFRLDRPNIVVGQIGSEDEGLPGTSIAQKIEPFQKASEVLVGMALDNLKQSVNAGWALNKRMIVGDVNVNEPGFIIWTNDDVTKAARRIEQPRISPDLFVLMEYFKQRRQLVTGFTDPTTGVAAAGVETLGEATQVLNRGMIRSSDYIRSFENSYVVPLYEMRNHINATFIDAEYAYRIVGDKAAEWRQITPGQMRASVDFICEASTREVNKAVIVQQHLQFVQMAPLAINAGYPVRIDKMMAKLASSGFSMPLDDIYDYFPFIRAEKEGQVPIDDMIMQKYILQVAAEMAMMAGAGQTPMPGNGNGTGQEIPQSTSEEDAVASNQQRNQPHVRSVQR